MGPHKELRLVEASLHLPVLVLWLEGHQGALFAAREDVLWGGAVNLLQLAALLLPLTAICSQITRHKVKVCTSACMSMHSCALKCMLQMAVQDTSTPACHSQPHRRLL